MKRIFMSFLTVFMALNTAFSQNTIVYDRDALSPMHGGEYFLFSPQWKIINNFEHVRYLGNASEGLIVATDTTQFDTKLGYVNAQTGAWVIKPQYERRNNPPENDFQEGLAVVIKNGKNDDDPQEFGAIDKTGKLVIPFSKGELLSFSEGLAAKEDPKKGNKYGFVDKSGKWVIPAQWGVVEPFKDGMAAVSLGNYEETPKFGFIDKTGKVVIPYQWEIVQNFKEGLAAVALASENSKYAFIDKSGKTVIQAQFSDVVSSFQDGLAIVKVKNAKNDKNDTEYCYFIDKTGKVLTQDKYLYISPFSEGLAAVEINADEVMEKTKMGFIDRTGKLVIPTQFKSSHCEFQGFSEGLAPTDKGYIDTKGKLVVAFPDAGVLESMTPFKNGVASLLVWNKSEDKPRYRVTLVDKTGKILWQSEEKERYACFPAGVYVSMADGSRKKIEDIQAGDKVIDLDNTPSVVEVVETHTGNFTIGKAHFNMPENISFVSNGTANNTVLLEATLNHPLSINGEKTPFSDVKTGDKVLQMIDNQIVGNSIRHINLNAKKVNKVYNLRTKGKGYFVNGYGVFNK